MTLVQLRHLISLAQTSSFSKSAEAMFITQPALSRSIQALESELGQALFDRVGRRSELTPFGRDVLARAQGIVLAADELQASRQGGARGMASSLRVGLGSGPGALLMTPLLVAAAAQQPPLRLEISRGRTELLARALRERSLDALVVDARSLAPATDLRATDTYELRGAFLCRRGHPLARRRKPVSLAQLRAYPVAATPLSDEVGRALVERYGPEAHPDQLFSLRCEELPSLVDLVHQTDVVLMAIRAAGADLVEVKLQPALDATARFALVTLAGRSEAPALALLRDLMRTLLRDG